MAYKVDVVVKSQSLQELIFTLFNPMTLLFLCLLHGGSKVELAERKIVWIQSRKHNGFSHTRYISCSVHRSYSHLSLLTHILMITQFNKRLRFLTQNAKCMWRYKTFKKIWRQDASGRLYAP
jgi:hypothetical protein